MAETRS